MEHQRCCFCCFYCFIINANERKQYSKCGLHMGYMWVTRGLIEILVDIILFYDEKRLF